MTYLAICKCWNGLPKTVWLHNVENFRDATVKALALEQEKLPEIEPKAEYQNSSDEHHHEKEILGRRWENEKRIRDVVELKVWHLG